MDSLMRYINRTARCATMYRSFALESEGISGHQHVYILNICRNPGISQDSLAKMIFVNKSNVARQVATLEQNGYIVRQPSENDRRVMRLYPTQKAIDVLPKVHEVTSHWNAYLLAEFTEEQREQLFSMLAVVMNRAAEYVETQEGGENK